MDTSYFANLKNVDNPLAICGWNPGWYNGPSFKQLAPKYSFFKDYKDGVIDEAGYVEQFKEKVLAPLNARYVYDLIVSRYGENVTLLCYEKPGEFCHRRIVAEWFEAELGIKVPERIKQSNLLDF